MKYLQAPTRSRQHESYQPQITAPTSRRRRCPDSYDEARDRSDDPCTRTKLLFNRVNDKSGRASDRAGSAGMQLVCINAPAPTHPPSRRVPSERRRAWQNRCPQAVTSQPAPATAHGVATSSTSIPPDTCLLFRRVTTACGARCLFGDASESGRTLIDQARDQLRSLESGIRG
jgi:hypothetical protein